MTGTIFQILGTLMALLWLFFIVKTFMVKVELPENKLLLIATLVMTVVGVYCAFTIVTNCGEITQLEHLKNPTDIQTNRLDYLKRNESIVLIAGYTVTFITIVILPIFSKRKREKEIEMNSVENDKWNK